MGGDPEVTPEGPKGGLRATILRRRRGRKTQTCPSCRRGVPADSIYCPRCGNHLGRPRPLEELPQESRSAIRLGRTGSLLFGFGLVVALAGAVIPFLACDVGGEHSLGCFSATSFFATSLPLVVGIGIGVFGLGLGMMFAAPQRVRKPREEPSSA